MAFDIEPRDNFYTTPRDRPADQLHYSVVQVSEYRWVVAEYQGGLNKVISWRTVSRPMRCIEATNRARDLTMARGIDVYALPGA